MVIKGSQTDDDRDSRARAPDEGGTQWSSKAIRPTMIETPGINGNQTALGKDALSGHQWQSDRTW